MKKYTSWGTSITVETTEKTFHDVSICPDPQNENSHLLEYYNGDVKRVLTSELISLDFSQSEFNQWGKVSL